ncbi:MAG: 4-oxalocrotonate tautomerase [Chloroflexi bacterium]|nr:4-oxalocrotonate tautomerase [Chloroflexota bacterium]|tara:strand:+ start:28405 stop:28590 length:186 start_codon:yes stop_codon:yes gene_type:complete
MPYIEVLWFPGRDETQKKQLVEEITDSFVKITGCKPSAVEIIFKEILKENSASSGKLINGH